MFVSPGEPSYPALLAATPSPPGLFVRGTMTIDDGLAVAIVGARRASAYGLEVAEALASDLAARGVTIVSGLARGIDAAAHRGALAAGGRTLAVLGSGIDVIYPPEHRGLAREIAARGAVLTEMPPGTRPLPWHFPLRNRIIAALSLGVVVVEAAERSGALTTATWAAELGREVLAVPGRVTSPASRGAHGLLRDGAALVESAADVLAQLPEPFRSAAAQRAAARAGAAAAPAVEDPTQAALLAAVGDEPVSVDELIARTGLRADHAAAALLALELGGQVRQLDGQRYARGG